MQRLSRFVSALNTSRHIKVLFIAASLLVSYVHTYASTPHNNSADCFNIHVKRVDSSQLWHLSTAYVGRKHFIIYGKRCRIGSYTAATTMPISIRYSLNTSLLLLRIDTRECMCACVRARVWVRETCDNRIEYVFRFSSLHSFAFTLFIFSQALSCLSGSGSGFERACVCMC